MFEVARWEIRNGKLTAIRADHAFKSRNSCHRLPYAGTRRYCNLWSSPRRLYRVKTLGACLVAGESLVQRIPPPRDKIAGRTLHADLSTEKDAQNRPGMMPDERLAALRTSITRSHDPTMVHRDRPLNGIPATNRDRDSTCDTPETNNDSPGETGNNPPATDETVTASVVAEVQGQDVKVSSHRTNDARGWSSVL